jgi:DUF917 family protein
MSVVRSGLRVVVVGSSAAPQLTTAAAPADVGPVAFGDGVPFVPFFGVYGRTISPYPSPDYTS